MSSFSLSGDAGRIVTRGMMLKLNGGSDVEGWNEHC
jgi:hypothetical protein